MKEHVTNPRLRYLVQQLNNMLLPPHERLRAARELINMSELPLNIPLKQIAVGNQVFTIPFATNLEEARALCASDSDLLKLINKGLEQDMRAVARRAIKRGDQATLDLYNDYVYRRKEKKGGKRGVQHSTRTNR